MTALITHRPFRLTLCALALSSGLCLAPGGAAVAAQQRGPTDDAVPAAATLDAGGPSWHQESVDFTGDVLTYRETASGFETDGTAYFERTLLTVGGPEHISYTTTASHS
ncbi:hypothetical protein [Streptomyces sp. NPDC087300]|uniref:hypothetical protein n=1 Tax=Streptomyces sp. NPDC087300 TaxID=3365780 RepID=UPI0038095142